MKKLLLSLMFLASFSFANEARDIVKKVIDRDDGKSITEDMTMILIDKNVFCSFTIIGMLKAIESTNFRKNHGIIIDAITPA